MSEERTVYQLNADANLEYLERVMEQMDLHEGMRMWIRAAYRLKGIRWAMAMVNAWGQK